MYGTSENITDADGLYTHYVETTVDPGWTLFILACIICACTLLALPCTVACGRRYQRRHDHRKKLASTVDVGKEEEEVEEHTNNNEDDANLSIIQESNQEDNSPPSPFAAFVDSWLEEMCDAADQEPTIAAQASKSPTPLDAGIRRRRHGARDENLERRRMHVAHGMEEEGRASIRQLQQEGTGNIGPSLPTRNPNISIAVREYEVGTPPGESTAPLPHIIRFINQESHHSSSEPDKDGHQPDLSSMQQVDQVDTCGPNSSVLSYFGKENIRESFEFIFRLAEYDNETKRLLRLAVPFTLSAIVLTVCEMIQVSIVSFYLGTEAMVAYIMVDILVGITSEFIGGIIESSSSLTSMAYGAGNNRLAGQYVQLCISLYVLFQIPFIFIWSFAMFDVMTLMGFDDATAAMAQEFARIGVVVDLLGGIAEGFSDFQEVIEKEVYINVLGNIEALVQLSLVALVVIVFDANLIEVGLTMMINMILFFLINVAISTWKGWIKPYSAGLFDIMAFKNRIALRQIIKTALPLTFGSVMAYAEWELLTIFAAVLGPAEAATWALLSYVWDAFEAITEGIGDAAEVRCAYHLGKGRPEMAKRSAYKSICLASILAVFATAVVFVMEDLPAWLTPDPTLQRMLGEQIPYIGLGNITMNMGMTSWALIGSQGRYHLATCIYLSCSWFIVIPIAVAVTFAINLDLQGLTFSVTVGYSVAAMLLSTTLLLSDWGKHSESIRAIHAITGEIDSSDSDESAADSSSSSSCSSGSSSSSCSSDSNSSSSNTTSGSSASGKGSRDSTK